MMGLTDSFDQLSADTGDLKWYRLRALLTDEGPELHGLSQYRMCLGHQRQGGHRRFVQLEAVLHGERG